jgi:hypothetical protein
MTAAAGNRMTASHRAWPMGWPEPATSSPRRASS